MVRNKKPSLEPIAEYKAEELIELTEKTIEKQGLEPVNKVFSKAVKEAIVDKDYAIVGIIIEVASICEVTINANIKNTTDKKGSR